MVGAVGADYVSEFASKLEPASDEALDLGDSFISAPDTLCLAKLAMASQAL